MLSALPKKQHLQMYVSLSVTFVTNETKTQDIFQEFKLNRKEI